MKKNYVITTVFQVRPSVESEEVNFEFTQICEAESPVDHKACFGVGHKKAVEYAEKNSGIVLRFKSVTATEERWDQYNNGVYATCHPLDDKL